MAQAKTDPAHAEKRIVLVREGEIRHDLVAADVERADDERKAVERFRHRLVGGELLVFRRGGFALEEKKFRAQQTDAFRAGFDCAGRFVGFADVGHDLDPMPVGHDRRLVARLVFAIAPAPQIDLEFFG